MTKLLFAIVMEADCIEPCNCGFCGTEWEVYEEA